MIARRFYGIHPAASSPDLANPELPNGCEITSCCEVLHYLGLLPRTKCELADYYLPRSAQWYGADPDEVYMGNPHLDDGSPKPAITALLADCAGGERLPGCAGQQLPRL